MVNSERKKTAQLEYGGESWSAHFKENQRTGETAELENGGESQSAHFIKTFEDLRDSRA